MKRLILVVLALSLSACAATQTVDTCNPMKTYCVYGEKPTNSTLKYNGVGRFYL